MLYLDNCDCDLAELQLITFAYDLTDVPLATSRYIIFLVLVLHKIVTNLAYN